MKETERSKNIITRLVILETRMEDFSRWQQRQNGELTTLKKMVLANSKSLDRIQWRLIGILGMLVINLVVILLLR